jgi:GT2 family glycosyltransferase
MMGPFNELRQKMLGALYDRGFGPAVRHVTRLAHEARTVDWASGACLLVRRVAAEAAGLFDERYFIYAEDVDFCAALRARGGLVLFAPSAEIAHLRGRSRATAPEATARHYRASQLAFYEKHHPAWAPLLRLYLRLKGEAG